MAKAMAMKAMKASMKMKATMAMKAMSMKKRAMKVSKIGKRRSVFSGKKVKTQGGLTRNDLKKNRAGKIVSKKASLRAQRSKGGAVIKKWGAAVKTARKTLNIKGFCPVGGKTAKGQQLLKAVRSQLK